MSIKAKIKDLHEEIEKAKQDGQPDRADKLQTELDAILAQLLEAKQKGVRLVFDDDETKVTRAVNKAMSRAIQDIKDPQMSKYFGDSFGRHHTSSKCFAPPTNLPWKFN